MQRVLFKRYEQTQDQLILNLNTQIECLAPIKESYNSLHSYHNQLNKDLQVLHEQQVYKAKEKEDQINNLQSLTKKLKEREEELFHDKEQLKKYQDTLLYESRSLLTLCDEFSQKLGGQNQRSIACQECYKDLRENTSKLQISLKTEQSFLMEVQNKNKFKNQQNIEIKYELVRVQENIKDFKEKNCYFQSSLSTISKANQRNFHQIGEYNDKLSYLHAEIQKSFEEIRKLTEKKVLKRQEILDIQNQKNNCNKLLKIQNSITQDQNFSETKTNKFIEQKSFELKRIKEQNQRLEKDNFEEQSQLRENIKNKKALKDYLSDLVKANSQLLEGLEESCCEDEQIFRVLNRKRNGLLRCSEQVRNLNGQIKETKELKRSVMKDLSNSNATTKYFQKTGKSWKLSDLKQTDSLLQQ